MEAYLYMHVNFLKDIKEAVNYGNLWKTKKQEDQGIHFMIYSQNYDFQTVIYVIYYNNM